MPKPVRVVAASEGKLAPRRLRELVGLYGHETRMSFVEDTSDAIGDANIYALNLGSPHRLTKELAARKGGGICVFDHIRPDLWKSVERNGGAVFLDMMIEAFMPRAELVEALYVGSKEGDIDPARIVVVNNNQRSALAVDRIRSSLSLPRGPKVLPFQTCFWLLSGHNAETPENAGALANRLERARATIEGGPRKHRFISFNGRARAHRTYFVAWLQANGLIDSNLISFLGYTTRSSWALNDLPGRFHPSHFPEMEEVLGAMPALIERTPLSIDVSEEESQINRAFATSLPWQSQDPAAYDQAYISLVCDTEYDQTDTLFLTPIAFKSFMNLSPFVYIGAAGSLRAMHDLGFETFSPYIDESYDLIEKGYERMGAIFAEVRRLNALTEQQVADMYAELWPRLERNYWLVHRPDRENFWRRFQSDVMGPAGFDVRSA